MDIHKTFSGLFSLNTKDWINGAVMAFLGSLAGAANDLFDSSKSMHFDKETFKPIIYGAITATISYLVKRFISNSKGEVFKPEPTKTIVVDSNTTIAEKTK